MTTLVKEESSLVMVALVASMVVVHMSVSRRDDYNGSILLTLKCSYKLHFNANYQLWLTYLKPVAIGHFALIVCSGLRHVW